MFTGGAEGFGAGACVEGCVDAGCAGRDGEGGVEVIVEGIGRRGECGEPGIPCLRFAELFRWDFDAQGEGKE